MPTYERRSTVEAPFEAVWDLTAEPAGLEALTPDWAGLCVEAVVGPDGGRDPDVLEAGTDVALSVRPFGVGPRVHWTSTITARERRDGAGYFRDEMVYGPFDRWVHTHEFVADGDRTVVRDHVVYDPPGGALAPLLDPAVSVALSILFRIRHRRAATRLE